MTDNPMPTKLSTMEELCDMQKSCVNKILDDDFNARDILEGNYKIVGDSSKGENFVKLGNSMNMKTTDGSLQFKYNDNIEVRTKFWGMAMKAKLKNGRFFEHYDFGMKQWNMRFRNQDKTFWFNPYLRYSAATNLTNFTWHLGVATQLCPNFSERVQLNYNPQDAVDGNSAWSVCSRKKLVWNKFWMNTCGGFNMAKFMEASMRNLRIGWNESNWALVMEANNVMPFAGGFPVKDSLSFGACWNQKGVGSVVGRVKHFMDDRPMGFEFGFAKKVNDKVNVKAKVDQDWNMNLFGKVDMCNKTTLETSLMTNLADSEKVCGLFDLPVKVGFKVKMNK